MYSTCKPLAITKALQNGWLIAPMTIITTHKHLDKP